MALATPYVSYTGYHDAKSYPSVAETQGKLVLPVDIYEHDLDFLSYTDKYVLLYVMLILFQSLTCISVSIHLTVIFQATTVAHLHH